MPDPTQKQQSGDGGESPPKRARLENLESKPEGSSLKRKNGDSWESPRKRGRLNNGEANASENPATASTPQNQGKARENTRMKEFPAGNSITSASRIGFLQSLCKLPKYLLLVDLIPAVVSFSTYADIISFA